MQQRRAKKEYRGYACHQCHKQKVKCSRERPCRNCAAAGRPCTYAVRDRKVMVPESYLRNLEERLVNPQALGDTAGLSLAATHPDPEQRPAQAVVAVRARRLHNSAAENSTAELFVSKLKRTQTSKSFRTIGAISESPAAQTEASEQAVGPSPKYEYFPLSFDTSHAKCTFKLPPYPYAIFLLDQFALYLGHDWHWFRLKHFRRRLENTYSVTDSAESKDRIWLCQLLVVLALSESVNAAPQPAISLDMDGNTSRPREKDAMTASNPPRGGVFFEQALQLLSIPFETASIAHIEALNLIVLYSNQLNRQMTAYMHAGASARLCNMLQLHQASTSRDCTPVDREHRKRLWWSTYCLDRMTSTQQGLLPTLQDDQTDLDYPYQDGLSAQDAEDFADPDYMTARIQLTIIEANNAKSMSYAGRDDAHDIKNIIRPMLQRLGAWKASLPPHMVLDMAAGIPKSSRSLTCTRSLANFYLRYNQCLILLLRPLLLKQVACIFSNEELTACQEDLEEMNNACLRSARCSLRILIDLRSYGLLARLGFMENMHLFTSLMILSLAIAINARRPGSFHQELNDFETYEAGKDVLGYMMQSGSLAAKGHLSLLKEVEEFGNVIALESEAELSHDGDHWNVDDWIAQWFGDENMSTGYGW